MKNNPALRVSEGYPNSQRFFLRNTEICKFKVIELACSLRTIFVSQNEGAEPVAQRYAPDNN